MHAFISATQPNISDNRNILYIQSDTSIGIDEIRQIQHTLSRKSTSGANIVIVLNAHTMTIAAQNAFLKTLEEPPTNSEIYLITTQPDELLPTIVSRCQIITTANKTIPVIDSTPIELLLTAQTPMQKLKWTDAQEFDRASALEFLNTCEIYIHLQITKHTTPNLAYQTIITVRKFLKSNCSVRLCMDYFALKI